MTDWTKTPGLQGEGADQNRTGVSDITPNPSRFGFARGLVAGFILAALLIASSGKAKGEFRLVPRWWVKQALCVHKYEGSWRDPGAPYYGGMQMDIGFQRAYGGDILRRFGTAERWHPRTQLIVAYRGWRARGWYPWPATARRCGLL